MTNKQRLMRDSQLIQFKLIEHHTIVQAAKKFHLSLSQVTNILRKYKEQQTHA